ncbi:hypothetical protein FGIG_10663 [Fasciola gigantica]|uniref:WW domain-containing protein n=1 Tax=Fasciola gigantica TaxID=46835 RepID=A0A504YV94_FASGI|nr:hypothetical protein FGIG_10663 [Fasciola gigantica]
MSRSSELQSALNEFLAEVDTIKSEGITLFEHAPRCEWIVQVDPVTQLPSYKHVLSGQTESAMPKAYERYLVEFDRYIQNKSAIHSSALTETRSHNSPELDEYTTDYVPKRRKHMFVDDLTSPPDAKSLQGLLGYSDSSGTEKESHGGLNARQRRRMKRAHRRGTVNRHPINGFGPSDPSESVEFIGPLLPPSLDFQTASQPKDSLIDHPDAIARPKPLSSNDGPSGTSVSSAPLAPNRRGKCVSDSERRAIEDSVLVLFDQFATLNVTLPDIARLHLLFVQLSTRFEDWKSGVLDPDYFIQKLSDLENQLCDLVSHGLPINWTCSWDSDKMQYVYTDLATGRIQSQPPSVVVRCGQNRPTRPRSDNTKSHNDPVPPKTMVTQPVVATVCPRSPTATIKRGTRPDHEEQIECTDQTSALSLSSTTPECLKQDPVDDESAKDNKQIDRTEHLIAQLREFEEVCRAFEDLDDLAPTVSIVNSETLRNVKPEETFANEADKLEKYKFRDKRAKILPSNPLVGGKALPHLMRKWQQLQENL